MPKAKTPPTTPPPSVCVRLATKTRDAEARYQRTLLNVPDTARRPSEAEARLLERHAGAREAACRTLALTPAVDLADWQAKARVLIETAVHSRDEHPVIHDSAGLVWSLLNDLISA